MASIKPIEGGSIHRIQSGQVIVDLCSVVKELVENCLDAGATAIDVRFRNHGLDSIEIQDNGLGISQEDYETVALKHYTSKLSNYDDLGTLQTFGFRGEALSSLCAVSDMHIVTAREQDAPKGTRLDFELSGKLKSTQVVASQRGTTVAVETIFKNLPVRRQELVKNIKREYSKVLGLLQAYACITTTARVSVSNVVAKGKKAVVFSTKSNQSTKDNIANIFGAKTLPALISLDLKFEMQTSSGVTRSQDDSGGKQVRVLGHVSRPAFGEGRQTPDRQMFFVNGRPCGLPQVAKVFNEVYKSYNLSQSPFIFANVVLDTNAYDVNVSPDKRTILLHDQGELLESIKTSLTELFENQQHTVPQSQKAAAKLPDFKQPTLGRQASTTSQTASRASTPSQISNDDQRNARGPSESSLIQNFAGRNAQDRASKAASRASSISTSTGLSADKQKLVNKLARAPNERETPDELVNARDIAESDTMGKGADLAVQDFNRRLASQQALGRKAQESPPPENPEVEEEIHSINNTPSKPDRGAVLNAFDRMRPMRTPAQTATITVGSKTMTAEIGSPSIKRVPYTKTPIRQIIRKTPKSTEASSQFSSTLRSFAAPGTQLSAEGDDESDGEPNDESESEQAASERAASPSSEEEPQVDARRQNGSRDKNKKTLIDTEASESECEESDSQEEFENDKPVEEADVSDEEYLDEETKKAKEEAKVARLIHAAEEKGALPSQDSLKRAQYFLKGGAMREPTANFRQIFSTSNQQVDAQFQLLEMKLEELLPEAVVTSSIPSETPKSDEERLSLTVSKADFTSMRIIGQFNLGFIIALRPAHFGPSAPAPISSGTTSLNSSDELFIIDQHASDEKYNFERLQATTIVQNQRLVHPQLLDLTAVEEEIVIDNQDALIKNGFLLSVDESGDVPVGRRCRLLSLPMSKEVTFSTRDLEELLVLLSESPPPSNFASMVNTTNTDNSGSRATQNRHIPRPSAIRRMFAMRACRSSIMIGKTLTKPQMEKLVSKMGELEKPWNCPHGRPTMRHLAGLDGWDSWKEGDGRGAGSGLGLEEDDEGGPNGGEGGAEDIFWEKDRRSRDMRWGEWLAWRMGGVDEDDSEDEGGGVEKTEEYGEGEHEDGSEEPLEEEGEEAGLADDDDVGTLPNIADRFSYHQD